MPEVPPSGRGVPELDPPASEGVPEVPPEDEVPPELLDPPPLLVEPPSGIVPDDEDADDDDPPSGEPEEQAELKTANRPQVATSDKPKRRTRWETNGECMKRV
jgi:hypothetical protein